MTRKPVQLIKAHLAATQPKRLTTRQNDCGFRHLSRLIVILRWPNVMVIIGQGMAHLIIYHHYHHFS